MNIQPGTPEALITAEFMELSALQAEDFGYSEDKAEDYVRARGAVAGLAIEQFGVKRAEDITEEMVEELALLASPSLENKRTEDADEKRRLKRAVMIDPLTGVASRAAYDEAIGTADSEENTRIIMFDGDNVGLVNKEKGHTKEGDRVIKDLAEHIRLVAEKYGAGERVFRYGGDEFVVLAHRDTAKQIKKEVVKTFGRRDYGSATISITGAVGKTAEKADEKLIKAKSEKKARQA